MRYGIIAALEFEERIFRREMKDMQEVTILSKPAYYGRIGYHEVIIMQCGMGKVSAGISAQAMIDMFHPDVIINTGCAGALDPNLKVGDVVISEEVIEWDIDLRPIGFPLGYIDALNCVDLEADEKLIDQIYSYRLEGTNVVKGLIVSGDQFVHTTSQREHILNHFPSALCTEMEGAAIGHVCLQNKIPFCIIRTMSDTANGDGGVDFATFGPMASEKAASWLLRMLKG